MKETILTGALRITKWELQIFSRLIQFEFRLYFLSRSQRPRNMKENDSLELVKCNSSINTKKEEQINKASFGFISASLSKGLQC